MKGREKIEERVRMRERVRISEALRPEEREGPMAGRHRGRGLVAAMILMTGILAAGCAKKSSGAVERIQALGNLQVAVVDTQSRYTQLDGETLVGVEPELVQRIAQTLGVTVQYQVCDKTEALAAVAAGEADIALGCINHSGSLSGEYLLSTEYGKGYFYAVTKSGDYALTVGALENASVGVNQELDEETRTKLYQAEGIRITDYGSAEEGKDAVKNGTIRAYICYEEQAKTLMEDEDLQVQNLSNLEPEEFVIVARKSDVTLMNGINTLIRQFLEEE